MAKVKLNPIVEQVRGGLGDLVFRQVGNQTVLSRKADLSGTTPTANQVDHRDQFRQAVAYGKVVLADAQTRTFYEDAAKHKGMPVFALTVADFMNAPAIDEIDLGAFTGQVNDPILIRTHDDVEVQNVYVSLANGAGTELENGNATLNASTGYWEYNLRSAIGAGTSVRITVTAQDRPGGEGVGTAQKSI